MIINWKQEMKKIDPEMKFRAEGGWLKTVEELDKSVKNGYSLVGDFVKAGDYEEEYDEGLSGSGNEHGRLREGGGHPLHGACSPGRGDSEDHAQCHSGLRARADGGFHDGQYAEGGKRLHDPANPGRRPHRYHYRGV